jgi:transcriptional regulator with XRE-family HTH domain
MREKTEIIEIVSENIKIYRIKNGFSQEELANICGLHRTYIGSVERGERNITIQTLEIFAQGLNVPIVQLLTKRE